MSESLCHLTISQAQARIAARELSPVELCEAFIERIMAFDPVIASYIYFDPESVRRQARTAEAEIRAGRYRGALHGIPYSAKDTYFTAGIPTTACSRLMLDFVPDASATAIARLDAAGAILLGKLNTWEFGTGNGAVSFDLPFPPARNPWNTTHFTGGSSTGSGAAMAAGLAMFTLGTDTGGSVRLPAAGCGVQGLKPTFGRISRAGIVPNCYAFDTPGILAWTVEDCALVLSVLAGADPQDPVASDRPVDDYAAGLKTGLTGLRIGFIEDFGPDIALIDADVMQAFRAALDIFAVLGAELVPVRLPIAPSAYRTTSSVINLAESFTVNQRHFLDRGSQMGSSLHEKMVRGSEIRAVDYIAANHRRKELTEATDAVLAEVTTLIAPTTYQPAPSFEQDARIRAFTSASTTHVFSLTGHPAISVCMGFSASGLPLGLQIAGRSFDEATVLRVAHAYEEATPWRNRRPILPSQSDAGQCEVAGI